MEPRDQCNQLYYSIQVSGSIRMDIQKQSHRNIIPVNGSIDETKLYLGHHGKMFEWNYIECFGFGVFYDIIGRNRYKV